MAARMLLGLVLALGVFGEITEEEGVWVLNEANFDEALSIQPNMLIEFYAPWCGHCKKLAPEYAKAAQKLAKNNPPIRIAKVDATANTELAKKYKVEGYPTLKYFVNKTPIEYTGGRTEDTIVSWILKKNTPTVSFFSNSVDLKNFIDLYKVVVVLFANKDSEKVGIIEVVGKSFDSVTFAVATDAESAAEYGVSDSGLIILKKFDDKRADFQGKFNNAEITKFINEHRFPWVMPFGDDAIELIFKKSSPGLFLFCSSYSEFQNAMETLSKEFKGTLAFTWADLKSKDNSKLSEHLGIVGSDQPTSVIVDPRGGDNKKYRFSGQVSYDSLKEFINNWTSKKLEPYLKTQDVPQNSYDGSVRVLVGKNFEEVVFDKEKDVLVEFYAPWCGHCKKLAPEYEKLAEELKGIPSVVIAKMDSTVNEAKGVAIKGFPTLKFYRANNKSPMDYSGDRNFDGLLKFVKDNASIKFETTQKVDL
ncbi:hypothetical protein SteCoe_35059 [Stentor coeruleus]|uniref:Protein disulfide-isomerase n=1 Tax=Stentor coeruleus TaxID=5963 RepID=A0A1R2ATB7_9CILI|nr:hypothetical protein SteCoe_35059 [Stentor coeruleus]